MKLSDMKPCPICSGPIAPIIYEITVKRHFVDPAKANQMLGLAQMMSGSIAIAEAMGPHESVTEQMDEYTAYLCQECGIEIWGTVIEAQPDDEQDIQE